MTTTARPSDRQPRRGGLLGALGALTLALSAAGCIPDWRVGVRHTAGFEHSCPEEQVIILGDDGDAVARSVRLDVCGRTRLYRDVGGLRAFVWMDATSTTGRDEGTASAAATVVAAPAPVVPWPNSAVLALLRQIHEPMLACTGGETVEIQATINARGLVQNVTGLGTLDADARACAERVLGDAALPGEGGSRRVSLRVRAGAADEAEAVAPSGGTLDPGEEVRTRLDEVSARVLACVGDSAVAIEAQWSAGDAAVRLSLGRVDDAAAIDCAMTAIGELRLSAPPAEDGRILHAIAR